MMNLPMTVQQAIDKNKDTPNWLWQGSLHGFNAAYQESIQPWLLYRRICVYDDVKWQKLFIRCFNLYQVKYDQLLKVEINSFDPLLQRQYQNQISETSTLTGTENRIDDTTHSTSATTKRDSQYKSTTDNTGNSTTDSTMSGTDNTSANASGRNLFSDVPQSLVDANTTGNPSNIDWTYATNLTDNVTTSSTDETSESTNKVTGSTHENGTQNDTTALTGTDTGTDTGKLTSNVNKNDSNKVTREESGTERTETQQDLYMRYYNFVYSSNATQWLLEKLDKTLLSVYDEEAQL